MVGTRSPAGHREAGPANLADGSRRSRAAGSYVRPPAARLLMRLATSLLRMVERAYRSGYLDLAQVEYSVRISAKLRGCACRMIGEARNAPSPSAADP